MEPQPLVTIPPLKRSRMMLMVLGTGAAVGLVVLRTQRKRHRRRAAARNALDLVDSTLRDFGREALRVFDDIR
jgi:hypothetical protein